MSGTRWPRVVVMTAIVCISSAAIGSAHASAAEIKVMSANGLRPVLGAIAGRFEAASGDKLTLVFAEAGELLKRAHDGEGADVYVLPKSALEGLTKEGKVASDSRVDVASTTLGLAVRSGAPKPDTTTIDEFRRWLLRIKSIAMTDPAAGGIGSARFLDVLQRLGIADAIAPRLIFTSGTGSYNAQLVTTGRADAAVQLSYLLRQVRGVDLVPSPAEFELKVTFSAGVSSAAKDEAAAGRLVRFLSGASTVPVIKSIGMQPG